MWVLFDVLWFTDFYFCLSTEQQSVTILAAIGHPNEKTDFLSFWPCHPLQYSCLENPTDIGAWWATVHGVAKSGTRLSDSHTHTHTHTHTHACEILVSWPGVEPRPWRWKCWVLTTEPRLIIVVWIVSSFCFFLFSSSWLFFLYSFLNLCLEIHLLSLCFWNTVHTS